MVRPLLACLALAPAVLRGVEWTPTIATAATWQDNLSNADRDADRIGALVLSTDLATSTRRGLSATDALLFGGHVAGESAPRFTDFDHASLGVYVTWQRKPGLGPTAAVWSATVAADDVIARDAGWSGHAAALTLAWRRRFDPETLLHLSTKLSRLDAREALYDRSGIESSAVLTRTVSDRWQLGALIRLRFGDVLAYATPPRPDLVALARDREAEDTFGRPMVAYTFSARSLSGGLTATRVLGERTSLELSAEYRLTEKSSFRYVNRLVSAALAHQF